MLRGLDLPPEAPECVLTLSCSFASLAIGSEIVDRPKKQNGRGAAGLRRVALRLARSGRQPPLVLRRGFAWQRARFGNPFSVVRFRNCGELLNEGSNIPDFQVGSFDEIESWHASHVDAVADDPENLRGREVLDHILEIRRSGRRPSENFAHMTPGPP
jgi:hypothetical protein